MPDSEIWNARRMGVLGSLRRTRVCRRPRGRSSDASPDRLEDGAVESDGALAVRLIEALLETAVITRDPARYVRWPSRFLVLGLPPQGAAALYLTQVDAQGF